jgi:diadenylate cyclase
MVPRRGLRTNGSPSRLDGAFVICETVVVVAACRYLDASVEQIDLPLGRGSRHLAAASISQKLGALAIVVSESGVVQVFHRGHMEATLIPELWLLDRHHTQVGGRGVDEQARSVEVLTVEQGAT